MAYAGHDEVEDCCCRNAVALYDGKERRTLPTKSDGGFVVVAADYLCCGLVFEADLQDQEAHAGVYRRPD